VIKFDKLKKNLYFLKRGNFEGSKIFFLKKENNKLNSQELIELEIAKEILKKERDKELNPFFDNKVQTDLNVFWFILKSSLFISNK
jgi:Highly conserved protein containing a thioredoxin domain